VAISLPDKFEAGTPAIVNIIAFAKALRLIQQFGTDAFQGATTEKLAATDMLYHDELEQYAGRELLDALRQTLIGRSVRVPTVEGAKPYINLDNAASTPTFTPIWEAVCQTWHQPRQVQQAIIHEVKSICAEVLGASLAAYDVIFTSNTTEAINLVAESLGHESEQGSESVVLNTLLEHNSNELPWRMLPGASLIRLPVDAEGFVDLNELKTLLCTYNAEEQALTGRALRGLAQIPGLKLYGIKDPYSPRFTQKGGVTVFGLKDILSNRVAKELAERGGIGVRYGCHCAHLLIKRLLNIHPLLERFQGLIVTLFPKLNLPGLVRVSLGIENSEDDVGTLIHVLGGIARQPRAGAESPFASTQADVQQQMDDFTRAVAQRIYTQRNQMQAWSAQEHDAHLLLSARLT
jgi:selenocysteine lyase/cysteine desulfurase